MYYLGLDIGSSSVKVAIVEAATGKSILSLHEPPNEMEILSIHKDWAEQDPKIWWKHICNAIKRVISESNINYKKIISIGISYQMHGLVILDKKGKPLRNSIIWCDSRAVEIGNKAFESLGNQYCENNLLNSPGNFTASKLRWVQENEPELYEKIHKIMLPGDYVAYKLTGEINTTKNGLSEGIFWDYKNNCVSKELLNYYGIDKNLIPNIVENFTNQGEVNEKASIETGLPKGITVTYRAGDQPNNALSLNIFNSGEVAATGGTSGVIYAVTDSLESKESSRINNFAHVNHSNNEPKIGKLLCINCAGIQYRWLLNNLDIDSYDTMNKLAKSIEIGSDGVTILPFGNGAERMLNNKTLGTQVSNLNLNLHNKAHLCRAALEGIAFSFVYGMEIMKNDGVASGIIRAGNDNLFQSEIFSETIATLLNQNIEIYNTTGAIGAARACILHTGNFEVFGKQIMENDHLKTFKPNQKNKEKYTKAYQHWKSQLEQLLKNN